MQFEFTAAFEADAKRLRKRGHLDHFKNFAVQKFAPAAARFLENPGGGWPKGLRVKRVVNAPGIWEVSWSMSDPDGRATFEWIKIGDTPAIRWRRAGDHSVLREP